jgi:hypothetical protein
MSYTSKLFPAASENDESLQQNIAEMEQNVASLNINDAQVHEEVRQRISTSCQRTFVSLIMGVNILYRMARFLLNISYILGTQLNTELLLQ